MRLATSCHHTNPRSATLHFWRQTSSLDEYKRIQHMRRIQTNQVSYPDSGFLTKDKLTKQNIYQVFSRQAQITRKKNI